MAIDNETLSALRGIVATFDDLEDLRAVNDIIRARWDTISRVTAYKFSIGDSVRFRLKNGQYVTGSVTKIGQKKLKVLLDLSGVVYSVPSTMLERR